MFDEEKLILIDPDTGEETVRKILFTFNNEEFKKDYVVYCDPDNPENVWVMSYDEQGNLFNLESDKEYDMVDEVYQGWQDAQEMLDE